MIPLLLHFALGALTFWAQDLPGIRVNPVRSPGGEAIANFRLADINHDGVADLLSPQKVLFQKEGGFPPAAAISLPVEDPDSQMDVWEGSIFILQKKRLSVFTWENGAWQNTIAQEIDWPVPGEKNRFSAKDDDSMSDKNLDRLLCDLDGDGVPELAAISEDAVHLFRREGDRYIPAAQWHILPPLTLTRQIEQEIWPQENRALVFPARYMSCHIVFETGAISITTRDDVSEQPVSYEGPGISFRKKTYSFNPGPPWSLKTENAEESISKPLPPFLKPCRLNEDSLVDYAGSRWISSDTAPLPRFLYETWATTDNGESFQIRRSLVWPGFQPNCSFVDFDNDGDLDMVTEGSLSFDQGIRETIGQFLTSSALGHKIGIYRQIQGVFSKRPDVEKCVSIDVEQPPVRAGMPLQRYLAGELVNLTGDYNGDGYRDLLVRPAQDKLTIYLAIGAGFPDKPDVMLDIEPGAYCAVADINGDKKSDIVVRWTAISNGKQSERTRVFFAREAAP